jgi:hypothetical protein
MRRTSIALVGLSLLAVSCGSDAKPKAEPSASAPTSAAASESPSETPSESPSPSDDGTVGEVKVGPVFYADTFKDKSKGWTVKSTDTAKYEYHTDYATPLYTVTAVKGGFHLFPHPEFRGITREQLSDYEITALVQTTLSVGREDWFGVTCRDLSDKRYSFEMSYPTSGDHESSWVIAKHDGGKLDVLAKGTHTVGGSAFEISGACVGGGDGDAATLVMKVNDEVVGSVEDDDAPLPQGYGGIYLYSKAGKTTVNVLSFAAKTAELA